MEIIATARRSAACPVCHQVFMTFDQMNDHLYRDESRSWVAFWLAVMLTDADVEWRG